MNQPGSTVICRRCGKPKPWTRFAFVEIDGVIMQPCQRCAKRDKHRDASKASKLKKVLKQAMARPVQMKLATNRNVWMWCDDGQWRRIVPTSEWQDELSHP